MGRLGWPVGRRSLSQKGAVSFKDKVFVGIDGEDDIWKAENMRKMFGGEGGTKKEILQYLFLDKKETLKG